MESELPVGVDVTLADGAFGARVEEITP